MSVNLLNGEMYNNEYVGRYTWEEGVECRPSNLVTLGKIY